MHPGAARYQAASRAAISARDTEIAAFSTVTRALESAETPRARVVALGQNHALWSTLVKDLSAAGNRLPEALKAQLLGLGAWAMHYSTQALLKPLSLEPLIGVNRSIAEGLAAQGQAAAVPVAMHPHAAGGYGAVL